MTGTIDLSIEQFNAIARANEADDDVKNVVRLVIHPADNKAIRVEPHSLCFGDVQVGRYFVLRNGEKLTALEYAAL